jgi:hypothetical protein
MYPQYPSDQLCSGQTPEKKQKFFFRYFRYRIFALAGCIPPQCNYLLTEMVLRHYPALCATHLLVFLIFKFSLGTDIDLCI